MTTFSMPSTTRKTISTSIQTATSQGKRWKATSSTTLSESEQMARETRQETKKTKGRMILSFILMTILAKMIRMKLMMRTMSRMTPMKKMILEAPESSKESEFDQRNKPK